MKCDNCGSIDTYVKELEQSYIIKGHPISLISKRRFCLKCNSLVYDEDLDNKTTEMAIDIYNKQYGIDKNKIIELRKKYNLSQELFSKVIGCAKKTLISYEKGTSIPNDNYLIILKSLLLKPELILTILSANKEQFTSKEYSRINSKLPIFKSNNTSQLLLDKDYNPNEYNGYTKLSREKIYNVILFLADNTILKTKLLKEMFYIDFIYYKNTCQSLTGLEYSKLPFGPVPDQFEDILDDCLKNNIIDYNFSINNDYERYDIKAKKKINERVFDKDELQLLYLVKNKFKKYSSKEIVDFSHNEKAFTATKYFDKISYDYAFDINSI